MALYYYRAKADPKNIVEGEVSRISEFGVFVKLSNEINASFKSIG